MLQANVIDVVPEFENRSPEQQQWLNALQHSFDSLWEMAIIRNETKIREAQSQGLYPQDIPIEFMGYQWDDETPPKLKEQVKMLFLSMYIEGAMAGINKAYEMENAMIRQENIQRIQNAKSVLQNTTLEQMEAQLNSVPLPPELKNMIRERFLRAKAKASEGGTT